MPTASPTLFSVETYGAKGDGATDDGPAIRKAVSEAAASGKPARLEFAKGKSYFLAYDSSSSSLTVNGAQDVVIDGNGATLLLDGPEGAVTFSRCERCTVRNLTVEYPKLPYTQGSIVAVDPANLTYDLALMPGYDLPSSQSANGWWVSVLGPTGHGLKQTVGDALFLTSAEPVAGKDRTYRVTVQAPWKGSVANLAVGDRSFLPTETGVKGLKPGALFNAFRCSDVTFEKLTIYSSPGMCFHLSLNTGKVTIRGVRIQNRPGTDRVMSSRSDGIHCDENRVGPTIEDCLFEGLMDDSINIHCMGRAVTAVDSDTQVTAVAQANNYAVGDTVQAFDSVGGGILGSASIVSKSYTKGGVAFVLSSPIPGMTVDPSARVPKTILYNISQSGSGFVIRNNTFLPQRRYAALIRAHDGLVEGNTVTGGAGYDLSNETGTFSEGPIPDNVIIRGNKFVGAPGIKIETSCSQPSGRGVRNILLDNNEFTDIIRWPIIICNAHNITAKNTTIRQTAGHPFNSPLIAVRNSDTVSFEAPLIVSDATAQPPCLVEFSQMTDADMATVKLDWSEAQVSVPHLSRSQYTHRM